jgi:hypothetical protein
MLATTYFWIFEVANIRDEPIGTYIVFFNVLCVHRVIDWFAYIKKDQVDYAKFYMI